MLHHERGLSWAKVATVAGSLFGIEAARSGWCRAAARVGEAAGPTYEALTEELRGEPEVSMDETGWRVAGCGAWLWAGVSTKTTIYRVGRSRGFDDAAAMLGADYGGVLVRDGWAVYRRFVGATHQTCLAHLLRRCHEMEKDAPSEYLARVARDVTRIFQEALELRGQIEHGTRSATESALERESLGARLDALCATTPRYAPNRRLLGHLGREREAIFTFLDVAGTAATNWRAEQATGPAVVIRKVWGGHRTWAGARVGERLMSLIRTCRQRGCDPIAQMIVLQRAITPGALSLAVAPP